MVEVFIKKEMSDLIDIPIIFDENGIARAYIQSYLSNNLTNKKII